MNLLSALCERPENFVEFILSDLHSNSRRLFLRRINDCRFRERVLTTGVTIGVTNRQRNDVGRCVCASARAHTHAYTYRRKSQGSTTARWNR